MSGQGAGADAPLHLRIWRNKTLRALGFMFLRIVVFIVLAFGIGWVMHQLTGLPRLEPAKLLQLRGSEVWLRALQGLVPTVLAYWLLVRLVERRRVSELPPAKALTHGSMGWLVGMGVLVLTAGLLVAFGALRVDGTNTGAYLLGPFVFLALLPGITEEIIARGILFRVVEDGVGTWGALVVSAALFGLGHAANPESSAWTSIAIAVEAGLLLGMAYAWTRSLWFCMGLHAAWNFTQGPLLGIPVSGFQVPGLVESSWQGPELISGGTFGAEASVVTVVVCTSVGLYFTYKAIAAGRIKPPSWRRPAATAALAQPGPDSGQAPTT